MYFSDITDNSERFNNLHRSVKIMNRKINTGICGIKLSKVSAF